VTFSLKKGFFTAKTRRREEELLNHGGHGVLFPLPHKWGRGNKTPLSTRILPKNAVTPKGIKTCERDY
jgi:hypothetical protein